MVLVRVAQEDLRGREATEDLRPRPEGVTAVGEGGSGGRQSAELGMCMDRSRSSTSW